MYQSHTVIRKGNKTMRKQTVKRFNINLTQKEIDALEYIKACTLEQEKYLDSDIIRDAIDLYAETLGMRD